MKYTQTTDTLVNSVAHVLTQATQAYLQYAVQSGQIPEPTTQEEIDNLGKKFLPQLALAAITKATFNPEGILYTEELAPFMELLADNTEPAVNNLVHNTVRCIVELRPEGTPPPTAPASTPEETDPIIRAKQGKSKIIIPGIND
jgi:hypothetical protein